MERIELSVEEAATLREMLEGYLGDLRMEVSKTDRKDFRDMLKEREVLLKHVIAQLGGAQPSGGAARARPDRPPEPDARPDAGPVP